MTDDMHHDITELLQGWNNGDPEALDRMMPLVYAELHQLARRYLKTERRDHTLQATALVHEAYLRLVKADVAWKDRVHFYAVAARCMRRILVDHARKRRSQKRGGGERPLPLEEALVVTASPGASILALDDALSRLADQDPDKCKLVELYYFSGLTQDEMAQGLSLSAKKVGRELRLARAWIRSEMGLPTPSSR